MAEEGKEGLTPEQGPKKNTEFEKSPSPSEFKNWLANDEEIENIKDKRLQGIVRQLNKLNPQKLNSNFLLNRYVFLQDEFSELENQPIDDFLARIYLQVEELQNKENIGGVSSGNLNIDIEALVNKISEGQKNFQENLLKAFKDQKITFEQLLNLSQKPVEVLTDSFKRVPPKEERKRWVDVEYRQEFYTRFTPSLEPRFYTELSEKERRLFDTRWQLARAAYFKKAYLAFPEKLAENQDLILLGMEHMEKLYEMPGVKQALEWYAKKIVLDKTFWDCKNEIKFEQIREEMRKFIKKNVSSIKGIKDEEEQGRLVKDADAVAWNWMWVSNLVESVDSRYSYGGERHKGLPGVLCSDDLRAVFHPQEKFEDKSSKGQDWGAFGKWGSFQMKRIEEIFKFNKDNDEIKFLPASNLQDFWIAKRTKDSKFKNGRLIEKGEIEAKVPECYPTTTLRSFWEGEKLDDEEFKKKINLDRKPNLLDFLLNKEEIKWKEIGSGFWVDYLPIKLSRAVKLLEHFKAKEIRMEVGKFGGVKNWVDPLLEIFVRLGLSEKSYGGEKRFAGKRFHNLKVWAVHAATGGEGNIESKTPVINLSFDTRLIIARALKDRNVKYLGKDENLGIMDVI